MKKILISINFIVFMFAVSVYADGKLRTGVLLPLSGENAHIGEGCQNGMKLALENLDSNTRENLEFLYEDDRLDTKTSVSAFNKLVGQDKINVAVSFSSSTSKALGPIADNRKVPLIAIASDKGVVENRSHVVTFWVTPEEQAKLLVKEVKRRGYKRIARISAIHNATEAFREAFDKESAGNIEIPYEQEFLFDAKDFKPFLIQLKTHQNIDAIFVNLFFGQVGTFARQARELGIELPLFGIETFEDKNEVETSGGALVGQWYIQADEGNEKFLKQYRAKYPEASSYTSVNCYDVVLLLAHAIDQKMSPEQFITFLKTVKDFKGSGGTFSATGDNRFTLPAMVKMVAEDGFVEVGG